MNYKEKYNAALERARELSKTVTGANYEYIFPELKESEDERIRKGLVKAFAPIGKKVDAAEVIEWIKNYASLFAANWAILEDVIEQFKRDFKL